MRDRDKVCLVLLLVFLFVLGVGSVGVKKQDRSLGTEGTTELTELTEITEITEITATADLDNSETESTAELTEIAEIAEEIGKVSLSVSMSEEAESVFTEYSYYLDSSYLFCVGSYGKMATEKGIAYLRVPRLYIPEDSEKADRINEILWNRCFEVFSANKELADGAEIKITYRSERYLCFEYIVHASLPEDFDEKLLKFTIDMEEEKYIDYPAVDSENFRKKYWWIDSVMGREDNEFFENLETAEDRQNEIWGDTGYQLCKKEIEISGVAVPCAQITGMENEALQEEINHVLQEPFNGLALAEDWEDPDNKYRERIAGTQIYVAYKDSQWLSILYSIQLDEPTYYKHICSNRAEFGVTVNMQTGKRCMLNDFIDMESLSEWLCMNYDTANGEYGIKCRMESMALTETEWIMQGYTYVREKKIDLSRILLIDNDYHDTFCISPEQLIIIDYSGYDRCFPLPEIYEWLVTDPWYGTGESFSETYELKMEQASLKRVEDGYELALYDKNNEEIYSEIYPLPEGSVKLPVIEELSEEILEVSLSVGSPAVYVFFFDKETAEISPTYFNPVIIDNQYVAYMDYDKEDILVFTDIFQSGGVYIEISRDFAPYANPIDAVIDIEMIDGHSIELQYYEGENFTPKSEVITLDPA